MTNGHLTGLGHLICAPDRVGPGQRSLRVPPLFWKMGLECFPPFPRTRTWQDVCVSARALEAREAS